MCKPIRDGGKRCPVHLFRSASAIKVASKISGLTRYQTERLFSELTREGRRAEVPTTEQVEANVANIRSLATKIGMSENIEKELAKSVEHDREIDGPTGYAQRIIIERSKERAKSLDKVFGEVAQRTGLTVEEVKHKYETVRDGVTRERGAEYPEEYTSATRANAVRLNVPYDVSSVVALERIRNMQQETRQRVTRMDAPESSILESYGYDDGRLEVTIRDNPTLYAYHDVPEDLWDKFKNSSDPTVVLVQEIAGRREFQYASREEAEADSQLHRCASCGQFANLQHVCAVKTVREEIAKHVPAEQVEEVLLKTPGIAEQITVDAPEPVVEETVEEENSSVEENTVPVETVPDVPIAAADIPTRLLSDNTISPEDYPTTTELEVSFGAEEAKKVSYTGPVTLEEQLKPTLVSPALVWEHEHPASGSRHIDSSETSKWGWPEEMRVMAENGAKHGINYIFSLKGSEFEVITSYDSNFYQSSVSQPWSFGKTKLYRVFKDNPNVQEFSEVSQGDFRDKEKEQLEALEQRDDVVKVNVIATVSKRDHVDAIQNKKYAPKVRIGDMREIKKAFKENKAVILPVAFHIPPGHRAFDDQGYALGGSNSEVEGKIVARRGKNGEVEILSSQRSLKCSCYSYRTKYYCSHVSYTYRHLGNAIAQATIGSVNNRATDGDPNNVENKKIRLLGALISRPDIDVVDREDGSHFITFGETIGNNRSSSTMGYYSDVRHNVTVPKRLFTGETPAFDDYKNAIDLDRMSRSIGNIYTPSRLAQVRQALKKADVQVPVKLTFGRHPANLPGNVSGTLTFEKNNSTNAENLVVKENTLKCDCPAYAEKYDCEHVRFALNQPGIFLNLKKREEAVYSLNNFMFLRRSEINTVRDVAVQMSANNWTREQAEAEVTRLQEVARLAEEAARAERQERIRVAQLAEADRRRELAERREVLNKETIKVTDEYVTQMINRWEEEQETYAANPDKFYDDVSAALKRKAAGEPVIAYRTENVTDGMAAPVDGARKFGVELEFDFPTSMNSRDQREALAAIGQELYASGLTPGAHQSYYHAAQNNGWDKWSFEEDGTVAGEIVSPILSDNPEDWRQLQTVCSILRKHGAIATTRTGSHVHVSTASYGSSTAKNAQLLRDTNADEDVLYRLASNPTKGTHRGTQWCGPNVDDQMGDISADVKQGHNVLGPISYNNHNIAVNFGAATQEEFKKQHVEFRHWDGTLDESIIQAQVLVSLGMVDRAERTVIEEGGTKKERREKKSLGSNRSQERIVREGDDRRKLTKEEYQKVNYDAMAFIDSIARRPEDKEQLAALVAITKWQS